MSILLLTGAPGVGKTTVVRNVAGALAGRTLGGFLTEEIRERGGRVGFRLEAFDGGSGLLAHTGMRSPHRVGRYGVDLPALDRIVDAALDPSIAGIFLVDEIGKMECFSQRFREAVTRLLDSDRIVVATIHGSAGGFIGEVRGRADAELWTITRENREGMASRVLEWVEARCTDTYREPLTAYPATERAVRAALSTAPVVWESLERPLIRCELSRCHGICCTDGVVLNDEVAAVLEGVLRKERDFFTALGIDLRAPVVVSDPDPAGGMPGRRTALRPRAPEEIAEGFPDHFERTACIFLQRNGHCALQSLAEARGLHPWYWKPLACWLHPVSILPSGIELPDERSDPYRNDRAGGFASRTFCGRTEPAGRPAREVLEPELRFLGAILGRDLFGERHFPPAPRG